MLYVVHKESHVHLMKGSLGSLLKSLRFQIVYDRSRVVCAYNDPGCEHNNRPSSRDLSLELSQAGPTPLAITVHHIC